MRLVLISSSAIANHDVVITIETRRDFFFSGLRPRFSRLAASPLACLGFACSNFAKKNKRLLVVYGYWPKTLNSLKKCLINKSCRLFPQVDVLKMYKTCTYYTWTKNHKRNLHKHAYRLRPLLIRCVLPPRPLKNRLVRPSLTFLGHHTLLTWQDQLNISSSSLLGNCNHHHKYYPTFGAFTPKCT